MSNENNWLKNEVFLKKDEIIFVENKENQMIIRQIPEANGAIIVLNHFTGDILAMSGGIKF